MTLSIATTAADLEHFRLHVDSVPSSPGFRNVRDLGTWCVGQGMVPHDFDRLLNLGRLEVEALPVDMELVRES